MKTFYSAAEIEQLASQGVRELLVDDDTVLTPVAREAAARLGIRLVAPGQPQATAAPATPAVTPLKPRGCQHGPAPLGRGQARVEACPAAGRNGQVVDDLIVAVRQLTKRS